MSKSSLAGRAIVAVLLTVGFYLMALVIAGGLLFICYATVRYAHRIPIKLMLLCIIGAFGILYAIFPRFDRFQPPGPRLRPEDHPRLFARLREVARAAHQAEPREVYLVPTVNAWVADRGGFMGLGSRRIMGLGLPLMAIVTPEELDAVLAHEFGHYDGGDTRLGPWIFKTRAALGRTLSQLESSWLQAPFRGYARLFLRITQGISRAQEFAADRMAAGIAGVAALATGLVKIHAEAPLFDLYLGTEYEPVLGSGFVAPLVAGFAAFRHTPQRRDDARKVLEANLTSGPADTYDSHPSLPERLGALGSSTEPDLPAASDTGTALDLLDDALAVEQTLIDHFTGGGATGGRLQPVAWSDVLELVYRPSWESSAERADAVLPALRLRDLPAELDARGRELAARLLGKPDLLVPSGQLPKVLVQPLGSILLMRLLAEGWQVSAELGEPVRARRGEVVVEPFRVVHRAFDPDGRDGWLREIDDRGLADIRIGTAAEAAGTVT